MLSQPQQVNELLNLLFAGNPRLVSQPIGNILIDIQIWKKSIILKYNVKSSLLHRDPGNVLSLQKNASAVCICHPQNQI